VVNTQGNSHPSCSLTLMLGVRVSMRPERQYVPPYYGEPSIGDGWLKGDISKAIKNGRLVDLVVIPGTISMDPLDSKWTQKILSRLATHPHPHVRGNAIGGFGHLARTTRKLTKKLVFPLIMEAFLDEHEYVRGKADDAASDIRVYMKWKIRSPQTRS
jgi:hypothetical protein